jgi:hypothetical protein
MSNSGLSAGRGSPVGMTSRMSTNSIRRTGAFRTEQGWPPRRWGLVDNRVTHARRGLSPGRVPVPPLDIDEVDLGELNAASPAHHR